MSSDRDILSTMSPEQRRVLLQQLLQKQAGPVWPTVQPVPAERHAPFPLTEIQQAYLIGRREGFELGGVSCHTTNECESQDLDPDRLERTWLQVVERHEMLRAVVLPDLRQQQILAKTPTWRLPVLDLRAAAPAEIATTLSALRERMSTQALDPTRWPLFDLRVTLLPSGRVRVHIDMDLLMVDAATTMSLIAEWGRAYRDGALPPPPPISFRDYELSRAQLESSEMMRHARAYWSDRLDTLPPAPELPQGHGPPRYRRLSARLPAPSWTQLKQRAAAAALTPSALIAAVFAEVLATWSRSPAFTLNLTLFNRHPLHPAISQLAGEFTSTLLLAVDRAPGSFGERAKRLQEQLRKDLEHAIYSGVRVLRDLTYRRGGAVTMPVVLTSTLGLPERGTPWGWLGDWIWSSSQTPQVSLDHQVYELGGDLFYSWDVVDGRFPSDLADAMFAAYRELLLRTAEADWSTPLVGCTPAAQLARRARVNDTGDGDPPGLLHAPFLARAKSQPESPAVLAPDRTLSYRELEQRSAALATQLREAGAGPEQLVALFLRKGWRQAVAALAVLRAGAAWLPMDTNLPAMRILHLLRKSGVRLVLTDPDTLAADLFPAEVQVLPVPEQTPAELHYADLELDPASLAYVIYTSGSTGEPKGVMIEHRAALATVLDVNRRWSVGRGDRVLALSALSFDLAVYDLFGLFAAGGAVVYPPFESTRDPAAWARVMRGAGVTIWNTVPALMEMLVEHGGGADTLRLVLLSGDWIPVSLPGRVRALHPNAQVVSLGGATEAAIWSVFYEIDAVDPAWASIPYGRPLSGQRLHVLDEALCPRPDLVTGELYISGCGLARGYLGEAELTSERFRVHPQTGERLYRTGDLARYFPDGVLEFLGREDQQVKIGGHRVELGEIEAALARDRRVRAAIVTAPGKPGELRRLVAYVVPAAATAETTGLIAALEARLSEQLPEWMVPRAWQLLSELPLSKNGKVDRMRLPPWTPARPAKEAAPATETERHLVAIWAELLPGQMLDVERNLFELGASSLSLVQAHKRLSQALPRLTIVDLYAWPTIRGLAAYIDRAASAGAKDPALTEVQKQANERRSRLLGRIAATRNG